MAVNVEVTERAPTTVVTLDGEADPAALGRVADDVAELSSDNRPIVVDISGLAWVHPAAVASFLSHLGASPGHVRLVCARLTGRRLLRRCLPHQICPPMFGSVAEAVSDLIDDDDDEPAAAAPAASRGTLVAPPNDVAGRRPRLHHQGELHTVN